MDKLRGFFRLVRPANIVTAIADILAGVTIAAFAELRAGHAISYFINGGLHDGRAITLLILSTVGLYGGGVVFNDVFDATLDSVERPERPIPSGLVTKTSAIILGTVLLTGGILAAAFVIPGSLFSFSLIIACLIALAALVYDSYGKHHSFLGPINMGACRGLNLLLGMSIHPNTLFEYWYLAFVPLVYIAAITMISRGEVHGGKKTTMIVAVVLYLSVLASICIAGIHNKTILYTAPFLILFGIFIFPPLVKALRTPSGPVIGKAVKAGVISLVLMNASWAAAFGSLTLAVIILLLLPVSLWLAKAFAVT